MVQTLLWPALDKRAEVDAPEATELAWLVVLLALRLGSGQLREESQRDLIAEGLVLLAKLRQRLEQVAGSVSGRYVQVSKSVER